MRGRTIKMESTITVVRGLPRLHVGQVLAHELTHAWLFENRVMTKEAEVPFTEQEALADMAQYLWLCQQMIHYEQSGAADMAREACIRAQRFEKRIWRLKYTPAFDEL